MLDPTLSLIVVTALVSALNPYTLGVLILMSSVVYGHGQTSGRVLGLGLAYIGTLFGLALLAGLGLLYAFNIIPHIAANYFALGLGILIVCAGLLEMKDYFWPGQGLSRSMPGIVSGSVRNITKSHPGPGVAIILGLFVAVAGAISSSAPYFATVTLLRGELDTASIGLLVLYSGIFVAPLLITLFMILSGIKVSSLLRWKEDLKRKMRLAVGLLLIVLGWTVILTTNGVLNFG